MKQPITIFAIYETREAVESAADALVKAGKRHSAVCLFFRGQDRGKRMRCNNQ
jgi:hypothetical protein